MTLTVATYLNAPTNRCPPVFIDSSSQPKVTFPKNLLTTAADADGSTLTAYLTVPQHHLVKDRSDCAPGVIGGSSSGERPLALGPHFRTSHFAPSKRRLL